MKIESRTRYACFLFAVLACLLATTAFAQYQGIWKDDANPPKHNFYIQHYSTGSTVVIYTTDATVFYAFLADISDDKFEATSMDFPAETKTLTITFVSNNHAVASIKDNVTQTTINTNIDKQYAAVRTMHSGIWKDATSIFSMYVQDYAVGSTVVVYTFDGVTFQAFLGDITMFLFSAANLADQSEEMDVIFTAFDKATVTVEPAAASTYLPAAGNFSYQITKAFSPATMDVDFQCAPTSGSAPLEVQFTDISTIGFTSWSWEFGDGGTSTEQDPKHTYNQAGEYDVVVVMSAAGLSYACMGSETVKVQGSGANPVISGLVTASGAGLPGVTLTASNGGGSATTNASGAYSITVTSGWSGTLTPSLTGYTFNPASQSFTNVTANQTQNFTATPVSGQSVTISGAITSSGAGLLGVTVALSTGEWTTTNASGAYSFTLASGWSGTVTPSLTGYTFTPTSKSFANVTTSQTQNFTASSQTVTISGTVTLSGGGGINMVQVEFQNLGLAFTDFSGNYSYDVPYNWSGTVTPYKDNYTFSPPQAYPNGVTTDVTGLDFVGSLIQEYMPVSGTVTDGQSGLGIQGVQISLQGWGTTGTDAQGHWSTQVPYEWGGAISASKANYTFWPVELIINSVTSAVTGVDFTGTLALVTLSGTVTARPQDGGLGISGVTISYTGDSATGSTTTDATGYYSFTVPSGWSGYASAAKIGWTFVPPSISYTNQTTDSVIGYTGFADLTIAGNIVAEPSLGGYYLQDVDVAFVGTEGAWSVKTDIEGNYSSTVPYDWVGDVTPTRAGFTFVPVSISYGGITVDDYFADFVGYED